MAVKCTECGWRGTRRELVDGLCPDCECDSIVEAQDAVFLNTTRYGYTPEQAGATMTVGELIEKLSEFEEDRPVYFRNDDGYTYGYLSNYSCVRGQEEYECI